MPPNSSSTILNKLPVITLLAWLLVSLPRLPSLGFYYGDSWATIVAISHGHYHTYGGLRNLLIQFAPKPIGIFTHLLWVWTAGDNAIVWQASLAIACLGSAFLLYKFLRALRSTTSDTYDFTADICAALWLIAPIDLGATILPNMFNALLGQAMFFAFALRLVAVARAEQLDWRGLGVALLWMVGSYLSYESYYFQFFSVIGMVYLFASPPVKFSRCVALMTAATVVQTLCLIYNRTIGLVAPGQVGSKTFNPAWQDAINIEAIRLTFTYNLVHALGALAEPIYYCVVVLAGTALTATTVRLFRRDWKSFGVLGGAMLLLGLSYLITATLYAMAAYGMSYLGVESRVAMTPKFLYALCAFALMTSAGLYRPTRYAAAGAALILMVFLGELSIRLSTPWEQSWTLQQNILNELRLHEGELAQLKPSSVVVFVGPYYVGPAPVFQADIQLSVAVKEQYPRFQKWEGVHPYFASGYHEHTIKWTGREILQQPKNGGAVNRIETDDAWVWNYFKKTFRRMTPQEEIDPTASGVYLPRHD